ncbi:hypothetical protein GCM10017711_05910 [Paeniglutamicibacter sulfureus]
MHTQFALSRQGVEDRSQQPGLAAPRRSPEIDMVFPGGATQGRQMSCGIAGQQVDGFILPGIELQVFGSRTDFDGLLYGVPDVPGCAAQDGTLNGRRWVWHTIEFP